MDERSGKEPGLEHFFARCQGDADFIRMMQEYCEKHAGCDCAAFMERCRAACGDTLKHNKEERDEEKSKA